MHKSTGRFLTCSNLAVIINQATEGSFFLSVFAIQFP